MSTLKTISLTILGLMSISSLSHAQINFLKVKSKYEHLEHFNCFSRMPNSSEQVKVEFVKKWSAFINKSAFNIPLRNIEQHMESIHACFSDDGWTEFSNAMNRSGNIVLVQSRQYVGTSSVEGHISVTHQQNNSTWETITPLLIIYSNKENRVMQRLTIHLRLQEEFDGQLRITQVVGIPREASNVVNPQ
jgi:hypothetical protein